MKLGGHEIQTALSSGPPASGDFVECEIEGIGILSNPIVRA